MRVLKSFPYDRIGSFRDCNPFKIVFIYTRACPKGFIVKGGSREVEAFMKTLTEPRMEFTTWWHHGKSRSFFCLTNFKRRLHLMKPVFQEDERFVLSVHDYELNKTQIVKKVKRIPRRWIKELNRFT